MKLISNLILPLIVLIIIIYGVKKKVNVYDTFTTGAKESFEMTLKLFPTLLAMILGINIFIKSGILDFFLNILEPLFNIIKVPKEILPIAVMRPISGSSGLALLNTIYETHGPDSLITRISSVIQGSTDTTLYVLTLYFGSIGIKKTRYALKAGLLADLIGIIASIIIVKIMF
ncbi:MAG: spore maturation protein [Bacilli bacterium]|nr:spore maturation protein [Bacilli bacterium]